MGILAYVLKSKSKSALNNSSTRRGMSNLSELKPAKSQPFKKLYIFRALSLNFGSFVSVLFFFINPVVIKKSDETLTDFEGCLSAPGKRGEVKRYIRITLKYQDEKGEEIVKTFYNLAARCIQHEMDHLEGRLCIDYEKGEYSRDKHKSQTMVESDFRTKSDT